MPRKIIVYGNPDKSAVGFPDVEDFIDYIKTDIFESNHGRYRYAQKKDADVIVLSREGVAYGHFDIASKEPPTDDDLAEFPPVKCVYIVNKSTLYANPVRLSEVGISGIQFGKVLSEDTFRQILDRAGHIDETAAL